MENKFLSKRGSPRVHSFIRIFYIVVIDKTINAVTSICSLQNLPETQLEWMSFPIIDVPLRRQIFQNHLIINLAMMKGKRFYMEKKAECQRNSRWVRKFLTMIIIEPCEYQKMKIYSCIWKDNLIPALLIFWFWFESMAGKFRHTFSLLIFACTYFHGFHEFWLILES